MHVESEASDSNNLTVSSFHCFEIYTEPISIPTRANEPQVLMFLGIAARSNREPVICICGIEIETDFGVSEDVTSVEAWRFGSELLALEASTGEMGGMTSTCATPPKKSVISAESTGLLNKSERTPAFEWILLKS